MASAPNIKAFASKLKSKTDALPQVDAELDAAPAQVVAPEGGAEPQAMAQEAEASEPMSAQTEDALLSAGMQLGPQLLGFLAGGAEGAEAAKRNVSDPYFAKMAQRAQLQAQAEKEMREAALKQEENEFDRSIKKGNLSVNEYEARTKRMALEKEKDKDKADKIKPTQYAAANYARRLELAEDTFSKLADAGYDPTSKTSWAGGFAPEFLKSSERKLQEQAQRNFLNAVLRRESGAAISKEEFASGQAQYFPSVGDTPEVLEQKRLNREIAKQSLAAEAGDALGQVPSAVGMSRAPVGKPQGPSIEQILASQGVDPGKVAQYAKAHGLAMDQAANIILQRKAAMGGKK